MTASQYAEVLEYASRAVFLKPGDAWGIRVVFWFVRIITVSMLLRTYIVPWILALMSKHIRVRSISFRSIRGLYFRRGTHVLSVERISYSWRNKRLSIKINGLSFNAGHDVRSKPLNSLPRGHNRRLTLADFAPSPMAYRLWHLLSSLYAFIDPVIRPLLRTYVVGCLRLLIRWLPGITEALVFELESPVLTSDRLPGVKLTADSIVLHAGITFTQSGVPSEVRDTGSRSKVGPVYGMAAWRRRLAEGFQRSLDRALGEIKGNLELSLALHDIVGSTEQMAPGLGRGADFISLPGAIELNAKMTLDPREGLIQNHTLTSSLDIEEWILDLDALMQVAKMLRKPSPNPPLPDIQTAPPSSNALPPPPLPMTAQKAYSIFRRPGASPVASMAPSSPSAPYLSKVPSSPFLNVISASMRTKALLRRTQRPYQPCTKLRDIKDTSLLSILKSFDIRIAHISVTADSFGHAKMYTGALRDITMGVALSKGAENPLHSQWLGIGKDTDTLQSNTFALSLAVSQSSIERSFARERLQVAKLGLLNVQVLTTNWPSPWLKPSHFLRGDANSASVIIDATLESVQMSERFDVLCSLLVDLSQVPKPPRKASQPRPNNPLPIPRVVIQAQCGPVRAELLCNELGSNPLTIELRTDGFTANGTSHFGHLPFRIAEHTEENALVHMKFDFTSILKPTFVRVRQPSESHIPYVSPDFSATTPDFLNDPPLFSMEELEVSCQVQSRVFMDETMGYAVTKDFASALVDLHVTTDAACVELWQPTVLEAMRSLLSIPLPQRVQEEPALDYTDSNLLPGILAHASLGRFVIFVTAPDINPDDNMELSRGFVLRTGLSCEYCVFLPTHIAILEQTFSTRPQNRFKLKLSEERMPGALAATKASAALGTRLSFLRVTAPDLAMRSAVASAYAADDPMIAEEDDPSFVNQEFLRIRGARIDIISSTDLQGNKHGKDQKLELSVKIKDVRFIFQLAHMYSMLLAHRMLSSLRPSTSHALPQAKTASPRMTINISTIHFVFHVARQKFICRLDGLHQHVARDAPITLRLNRLAIWVQPPSQCWDQASGSKWDELALLQSWKISTSLSNPMALALEGETARMRIPNGFILADLIHDIAVSVKALRHLHHVATINSYFGMPAPPPEGPKSMPILACRIRSLCVEAADDALESRLAAIWRSGLDAVKQRLDREDAFRVKVDAIFAKESKSPPAKTSHADSEYQFGSRHSIPIEDARRRLDDVHALDWALRLDMLKEKRAKAEEHLLRSLRDNAVHRAGDVPNLVQVSPIDLSPPLFRVMIDGLVLNLSPPSFPPNRLSTFLHERGSGLPHNTQFSLLIPMHIHFTLSSLKITLRDYPVPLAHVSTTQNSSSPALEFDTDLVIGEEMGTELSVDWVKCSILPPNYGVDGAAPLSLLVPKTIMPVKSYANPTVTISPVGPAVFAWGVSYGPATQDLMRVLETLSSPPRDSSPAIGFWDKMRLIFHWNIKTSFKGEVHFHMKGSRDPYMVNDVGAGFVLAWQGNPRLLIGRKNDDQELVQVFSETMIIAIPRASSQPHHSPNRSAFKKVCAQFRGGVRFGIGFVLERACGTECTQCHGTAFERQCRFFKFRPHYDVKLQMQPSVPVTKSPQDSFNGFRSDFIHLSISLTSSLRGSLSGRNANSSLHLTPHTFAHFWSWWSLFDGVLSVPIRQGSYYPSRINSPKLGRHLATLKYRIQFPRLFVMHAYMDDSRETWADGVTPWVGIKAMIDEFQADMHQRDQEMVVPGLTPDSIKVTRRKPFYAAEVVLKGADVRALLATFSEPSKRAVDIEAPPQRSNYRMHQDLERTELSSTWYDPEDFIETDWSASVDPTLHLLPVATLPRFSYFKRNSASIASDHEKSKFGLEKSHVCLLGKEPSVSKIQTDAAESRILELQQELRKQTRPEDAQAIQNMIDLLQEYVTFLQNDTGHKHHTNRYHMLSENVSVDEWAEFDNVYHIHCPKIFMDSAIRDIMMQYYYCSRSRRGLEYHMATRAVKFIRDQAEATLAIASQSNADEKTRGPVDTAHAAAHAIWRILKVDPSKTSIDIGPTIQSHADSADPLSGWSDGVSLQKSHCCLLLKPQIVLRGEDATKLCVVAAVQAKLQSYAIMDDLNRDDPISGKVMTRSYTSLSGLQTFAPTRSAVTKDGCVPLEVLIDLRCESSAFDRLVPQTDATFHYDKFNRLRLRNNVTSVIPKVSTDKSGLGTNHLQNQTDLIKVHIPRFTVMANDEHFQAISNIVTKLLLFSDATHKSRLDKLEILLFTYDFTDLHSAAQVVSNLQSRLRSAMETERLAELNHRQEDEEGKLDLLKFKAHIFALAEELDLLFDAIKLSQDRFDDQTDQKSALLLHASSSEISWRMLDERNDLLAKLVVSDITYHWLSRQDSSTVNDLAVGNLQAFDGSRYALWGEILSKHNEPANHPLLKKGVFLLANWIILAPVGGITIYETFQLALHPMRLQIDARVGRRIMLYLWPARRNRSTADEASTPRGWDGPSQQIPENHKGGPRLSLDHPRTPTAATNDAQGNSLAPPLRKLGTSRSFTDLRSAAAFLHAPSLQKTISSENLNQSNRTVSGRSRADATNTGDAAEMKTRASQKSFVLVHISSLNLLLSIVKEGSFECHDARIRTRDLEYRNQSWSFEELVNQFIPSDMSWRGWVKMAFHQPLIPVLPVARELISKTKWIPSSKSSNVDSDVSQPKLPRVKALSIEDAEKLKTPPQQASRPSTPQMKPWKKLTKNSTPPTHVTSEPFTVEPEPMEADVTPSKRSRSRVRSLFSRDRVRGPHATTSSSSASTIRGSPSGTQPTNNNGV